TPSYLHCPIGYPLICQVVGVYQMHNTYTDPNHSNSVYWLQLETVDNNYHDDQRRLLHYLKQRHLNMTKSVDIQSLNDWQTMYNDVYLKLLIHLYSQYQTHYFHCSHVVHTYLLFDYLNAMSPFATQQLIVQDK